MSISKNSLLLLNEAILGSKIDVAFNTSSDIDTMYYGDGNFPSTEGNAAFAGGETTYGTVTLNLPIRVAHSMAYAGNVIEDVLAFAKNNISFYSRSL